MVDKVGFMDPVDRRDAATLLPQHIVSTAIISDLWAAYNTLGTQGYQHLTCSQPHTQLITGACTTALKVCGKRRSKNTKIRGTHRELLRRVYVKTKVRA